LTTINARAREQRYINNRLITGGPTMETEKFETPGANASGAKPEAARTWTEEIEVAGEELVAKVKRLAAEGRVKRIRLVEPDGDIILEMPLTIGAIAGGAVVLAAPLLAVIGALAAFVTKVRIEVIPTDAAPPKAQ
jgi:Domain of unknown function (DUF4342)